MSRRGRSIQITFPSMSGTWRGMLIAAYGIGMVTLPAYLTRRCGVPEPVGLLVLATFAAGIGVVLLMPSAVDAPEAAGARSHHKRPSAQPAEWEGYASRRARLAAQSELCTAPVCYHPTDGCDGCGWRKPEPATSALAPEQLAIDADAG